MKLEFINISLAIFSLLFLVFQTPAQQESVFKKFAGTYITGHEFGGGSIKLAADGTFSDKGGSDDGTLISTFGNYALSDGALRFTITKSLGKRSDGKEFNLLDRAENKEMSRSNEDVQIEREFKLLPIEWSDRIYLIYEKDLKDFANAINLGIEPRASLISERYSSPWYGSFYLRSGDEGKKVTGKPNLPEKWLSFLLRNPLTATVIGIKEVEKREWVTISTVIVNKGSKDGLKVGMQLSIKNEEPSQWDGPEVISIERSTATILSRSQLKVGDKLSTRYKPKVLYR